MMDEPNENPGQNKQYDPSLIPEYRIQKQLRLSDILFAVRKHIVLIAACALVGLIVGIALSVVSYLRGEMSKQYAITSSIAVTSQDKNGMFTAQSNNPNSTDIYLAENMVDSVMYVMKSDKTLNSAIEHLGLLGISTKDIYKNLSMSQYNDTQIIEITLYWRSAQEGVEILTAINEVSASILIETLKIGNVTVINQPSARYLIGGSINAMLWIYMVLLGVMLGVGYAVLELLLRPTLLKTEDMEQYYNVEVLGEVPSRSSYFRKKHNLLLTSEDDNEVPELIDNYVSMAHIIKSRLSKMEHPCVYVTSAAQGEGKTTVSAYLAVQLAEIGMKVLVVDFDTRNPKLGGMFLNKVEYAHSINALYRGDTFTEEAITHLTANLDILPAVLERIPLPYDEPLLDIIASLKPKYDIVLIDTAPVGLVADTMSLNQLADVALMVVRFDSASLETIRDARIRLDKSGMKIMGCIINGVKNVVSGKYYHGYGKYGYYGYGGYGKSRHKSARAKTDQEREWERWEEAQAKTEETAASDTWSYETTSSDSDETAETDKTAEEKDTTDVK